MINANSLKFLRSFTLNLCWTNLSFFNNILDNFSMKLLLLDEISRKLCFVSDQLWILSLLVKNNSQINDLAAINKELINSMGLIQDYMSQLNSNLFLYNHLLYIKYHENNQFLNDNEQNFLKNLIGDYENKYGILKRNKEKISQILNEEAILKEKFEENIISNKENIEFPPSVFQEFHQLNLPYTKSGNNILIVCNFKEILYLTQKTNDSKLKLFLFKRYFNANQKNKMILAQLLKTRTIYANQVSFGESYAKFSLMNNSMIKNFFSITKLINLLMNEASKLKIQIKNYFKNKEKPNLMTLFEIPLKNALQKMQKNISIFEAIEILVNIFEKFSLIKLEYFFSHNEICSNFKTIIFSVKNLEEKVLGKVEITLTKFGFTQTMIYRANCIINPIENIKTQPKLYLFFDFFNNINSLSEISLNFHQMRNLIHEFAHAVHNVLSYHDFHYISNNTNLDYAEFIAILWEQIYIKQYNISTKNEDQSIVGESIEKLEQIYFSLIDLKFHNEKNFSKKTTNEIQKIIEEINTKIFNDIFGEYQNDPNYSLVPNHYYCVMSHLSNYPSIYYSYSLGFILVEELLKKMEQSSSELGFKESLHKLFCNGHNINVFYLILKEIF